MFIATCELILKDLTRSKTHFIGCCHKTLQQEQDLNFANFRGLVKTWNAPKERLSGIRYLLTLPWSVAIGSLELCLKYFVLSLFKNILEITNRSNLDC